MCCFFTILLLLGPRVGGIIWWIVGGFRWELAFGDSWIWPLLGIIFLPWTMLMYLVIVPFGGFWDWLLIILAIFVDLGSHGGGFFGNRDRIGV